MGEIVNILLNNFTTICLVIGFGIIVIKNRDLDKRTNQSFLLFILLVLILIFTDIIDYYTMSFPTRSILRFVASAIGYTLRPASITILIGILLRRKRISIVFWIPVILLCLIAFTSWFTHIMFWFNDQNWFMRGPLGYLSHIISGFYLIILIVLTIKMHRNISPTEVFAVMYSAAICVIATALESLLSGYKFLLTGAMITSCALYYVVLYVETYRRDPLTGLKNRRSFYLDSTRICGRSIAVISIDLNNLKDINDSQGHSAGDLALQCVGNAMLVKSGKKFLPYRVGGDEFMALGKGQPVEAVSTFITDMRTALKENALTASFGYAFYSPGDDFDDVCNKADACMYDDKKHYKHRVSLRDENKESLPHEIK